MFRQAKLNDYLSFCTLMEQVHKKHNLGVPGFYKDIMGEFPKDDYINDIKEENIYVLEEDNEIIGISYHNIIKIKDNPAIKNQKIMYIIDICIEEKMKNRGYGTIVLSELEKIAKSKKCNRIKLDVYLFNTEAIQFYKKMNFKEEKIGMSINI